VVAPAPVPADVGIVAAMPMEVGYLVDRLRRVRKYHAAAMAVIEGELDGKIVAIAIGGMGRTAARRAAGILLDGHRPSWIISAGFAGALNPTLNRCDLALPQEVVDIEGRQFPIALPDSLDGGLRRVAGRLLTVDRVILDSAEKQQLHRTLGADLVDMESSAVAALCEERLVRFLPLRVVSDDARTTLPHEVASLMAKSGTYRIGAALRAVWNRPFSVKDFWTLHEQALEAADRLAEFISRCVGALPA
jgi:adenosylhomocysteine nucleosidase